MDINQDHNDDNNDNNDNNDDDERTECYTPPPLDVTNYLNDTNEKENDYNGSNPVKQQSIIVLDDSVDQEIMTKQIENQPSN